MKKPALPTNGARSEVASAARAGRGTEVDAGRETSAAAPARSARRDTKTGASSRLDDDGAASEKAATRRDLGDRANARGGRATADA